MTNSIAGSPDPDPPDAQESLPSDDLARRHRRDAAKLADFTAFTASMRLGTEPAAPHVTIDNRLAADATLEAQVAAAAEALSARAPGS